MPRHLCQPQEDLSQTGGLLLGVPQRSGSRPECDPVPRGVDSPARYGLNQPAVNEHLPATQGIDYLLTWNFKHINNAERKALIAQVVEADGWVCPIFCSPEELGGNHYEE